MEAYLVVGGLSQIFAARARKLNTSRAVRLGADWRENMELGAGEDSDFICKPNRSAETSFRRESRDSDSDWSQRDTLSWINRSWTQSRTWLTLALGAADAPAIHGIWGFVKREYGKRPNSYSLSR